MFDQVRSYWLSLILLGSCADNIYPDTTVVDEELEIGGAKSELDIGGQVLTQLSAVHGESWVYFHFESWEVVAPVAPEASGAWDMAFRRFHIKLNGGIHGTGDVEVAKVQGTLFEELDDIPNSDFVTDQADGEDENGDPDYAMSSGDEPWYIYDQRFHSLSPRKLVYVVRLVSGKYIKMEITD
ncbi:MAG: HmuY family protein, partial [Myxococcales bacterium]|nr:HmuY family protein [Myxococcales bacterium]